MPALPQDVVGYWRNAGPRRWFRKDTAFDEALRLRFEPVHFAAARGQYDDWAHEAQPALALILLLDQIPRNIFRDTAHAWATDGKARRTTRLALRRGLDLQALHVHHAFQQRPQRQVGAHTAHLQQRRRGSGFGGSPGGADRDLVDRQLQRPGLQADGAHRHRPAQQLGAARLRLPLQQGGGGGRQRDQQHGQQEGGEGKSANPGHGWIIALRARW